MSLQVAEPRNEAVSVLAADSPLTGQDGPVKLKALHLAILFVVVTVGRCWFNLNRDLFKLSPDEPAYLAMARWISGGASYDLFNMGTYRPGYSILVAPIFWLTDDQEAVVVLALVISSALGGAAAVVLAKMSVRWTTLPGIAVLMLCGAIALSPSSLSASGHVWAEPLVTLAFLCTLSSLLRFFDGDFRFRWGCAAIVWSVVGFTAHGRLLPLVAVVTVAVVFALLAKRRWGDAVVAALVAFGLTAGSMLLANRVFDTLWADPNDINSVGGVIDHLSNPVGILVGASGQMWYLLVSTAGLFGIGFALLCRRLVRPGDGVTAKDARVVAAATLPLLALSVLFMSNRERADQLVYGRYNDAIVWPIIVIGFGWLVPRLRRGWLGAERSVRLAVLGVVAVTVETAMIVAIELMRRSDGRPTAIRMIAGIIPATGDRPLHILIPTIVGLTAFILIVVAAPLRGFRLLAAVAVGGVVLLVAGMRTHDVLAADLTPVGDVVSVQFIDPRILPPGSDVVYGYVPEALEPGVSVSDQVFYSHLYQWYLPGLRFRITETGDYPPDSLIFAPLADPILVRQGATVLWTDSDIDIALWRTAEQS